MSDINLLVASLGNSRLALGTFVAGELRESRRLTNQQTGEWGGAIANAWEKIRGRDNAAVVAISTNPELNAALEAAVSEGADRRVVWVGKDLELPIKVLTDEPELTGVDRVLNVAAAYEQMEKACVVVDAGTAVTIDLCDENGAFVGGAIAPGAQMMLAALHERTAKLPLVEFARPEGRVGQTTQQAMLHGVYHGIRGLVKEVVELYAERLGQWPEIIVTGGDAKALFEGWELIHAIAPDLTLYGIALAYAEHHIAHGT